MTIDIEGLRNLDMALNQKAKQKPQTQGSTWFSHRFITCM